MKEKLVWLSQTLLHKHVPIFQGESLRVILSAEGYDVWCTGDEEEDFRANSKQRASRMQSQDSDISNVEGTYRKSYSSYMKYNYYIYFF